MLMTVLEDQSLPCFQAMSRHNFEQVHSPPVPPTIWTPMSSWVQWKPYYIPIHRDGNHWGLLVFNVNKRCVEYDDGFHYSVCLSIQELADKTLAHLYEITTLQHFRPWTWSKVQRFTVPMPDQPNGSGSCGVCVIYCVRDLSQGIQEKITWTYKESPKLRAQLMTELLKG